MLTRTLRTLARTHPRGHSHIPFSSLSTATTSPPTSPWRLIVGLEIHAQILSSSKLFSGAPSTSPSTASSAPLDGNLELPPLWPLSASGDSKVMTFPSPVKNDSTCFIDAAYPGCLPLPNAQCVAQAVRTGLALHGDVQQESSFERKHYFYCDMPQGYQITQQRAPIVCGGYVEVPTADGAARRVRVERVQLEQDSGKNVHDLHPTRTYVDLNRAGVGLLEIVTMPDLRSAEEAVALVRRLQNLLMHLGVCSGRMADGSMRCDVNVSVRAQAGERVVDGERVEIKNLNSLRFISRAISVEYARQLDMVKHLEVTPDLRNEDVPIERQTRGYDQRADATFKLRAKEDFLDYRFMTEPDLPPLRVSDEMLQHIRDTMPELPEEMTQRWQSELGLGEYDCNVLLHEPGAARYFDELVRGGRDERRCMSWLTSELFGRLGERQETLLDCKVTPAQLGSIVDAISSGAISGHIGKKVLDEMLALADAGDTQVDATQVCERNGWTQVSEEDVLVAWCDEALAKNAAEVHKAAEADAGRAPRFVGFLVGQVMKLSKGKANPKRAAELVNARIAELRKGSSSNV